MTCKPPTVTIRLNADRASHDRMDLPGALASWLVPSILLFGIITHRWRSVAEDSTLSNYLRGEPVAVLLLISAVGLWVVPAGWFLLAPLFIFGAVARVAVSTEIREQWRIEWKGRAVLITVLLLGTTLAGFSPVEDPRAPFEWGGPEFTDNPNAMVWPSSAQYTWILTDDGLTIIVVTHLRVPGVLNPLFAAEATLAMIESTGADKERLAQAAEQLPGWFGNDNFVMRTTVEGITHQYGESKLPFVHKRIHLNLAGDVIAGEMATVALGEWGGEVHLLTIIKAGNNGFDSDPYAEELVNQWLAVQ